MAKFKTKDGQEWHPEVRFSRYAEIKRQLNIKVMPRDDAEAGSEEFKRSLGEKIMETPEKFLGALYLMVKDEADDRDMSREEVLALFDRGPLVPMVRALNDAQAEFEGVSEADSDPTQAQENP